MSIQRLVSDIKRLKIQGAESIALESAKALKELIKHSRAKTLPLFYSELLSARKKILSARPTEPCLRNTLDFIFYNVLEDDFVELVKNFLERIDSAIKHLEESKEKIAGIVAKKIPNNSVVFTHCHSSTVVHALIHAKKQGKRFVVYNTETRPLFQGRITAKELSSAGIKVVHFVDSGARIALKKADIMLIGCDAISAEGKVINKIGSEMFAEIAHNLDVPVYVCSDSWKLDAKSIFGYETVIEKRLESEVWKNHPKNVVINNLAFERVSPSLITGIISELGIYRPSVFVREVKETYPFMFKKAQNF